MVSLARLHELEAENKYLRKCCEAQQYLIFHGYWRSRDLHVPISKDHAEQVFNDRFRPFSWKTYSDVEWRRIHDCFYSHEVHLQRGSVDEMIMRVLEIAFPGIRFKYRIVKPRLEEYFAGVTCPPLAADIKTAVLEFVAQELLGLAFGTVFIFLIGV